MLGLEESMVDTPARSLTSALLGRIRAEILCCRLKPGEKLVAGAIDRQVFGAPFYFSHDEPFWGQDRLDHLDQALESRCAAIRWPALDDL